MILLTPGGQVEHHSFIEGTGFIVAVRENNTERDHGTTTQALWLHRIYITNLCHPEVNSQYDTAKVEHGIREIKWRHCEA